jgi:hypothetical protein
MQCARKWLEPKYCLVNVTVCMCEIRHITNKLSSVMKERKFKVLGESGVPDTVRRVTCRVSLVSIPPYGNAVWKYSYMYTYAYYVRNCFVSSRVINVALWVVATGTVQPLRVALRNLYGRRTSLTFALISIMLAALWRRVDWFCRNFGAGSGTSLEYIGSFLTKKLLTKV